jgi:uncharacterized membrane protein YeiH
LVGAAIVVGGTLLHLPVLVSALSGGLICFALRVTAIRRGWRLPVARGGDPPPPSDGP